MIHLSKVTKTFPGVFEPVIRDFNFSLSKGDFCTVIGANGSGKSTFLKLISGEYAPTEGAINCQGWVAQVVQDVNQGTLAEMTLLENMAFAYSRLHKPQFGFYQRYRSVILEALSSLEIGLETFIDQPLKHLSGGQRQAVALLMAVNSGADILLLDEHTSALDPKMQVLLMQYTAKWIAEKKLTALMITHKMEDALQYGNRLIMLHKGQLVMDMNVEEKTHISPRDLLMRFHRYEDETLCENP